MPPAARCAAAGGRRTRRSSADCRSWLRPLLLEIPHLGEAHQLVHAAILRHVHAVAGALHLEVLPGLAHRLGSDAEAEPRIDRDIEAPFLEPAGLDARRLAELDHVGEQRLFDLAADALELGPTF